MQFPTIHLGKLLCRQPGFLEVLWEVTTDKGLDPQILLPTQKRSSRRSWINCTQLIHY